MSLASWGGRMVLVELLEMNQAQKGSPKDKEVARAIEATAEPGDVSGIFKRKAPLKLSSSAHMQDEDLLECLRAHLFVAEDDNMVVYYKPKGFTHGSWSMANLLSKGSDFVDDVVKLSLEDEGRGKHPVLVYQLKQLGMKAGGNALLAMSAFSKR